jgi:hypothetical protein
MNTLTTLSSILLKSAININSFSFINSSKSLGIVLDTSGLAFTNNLGAGYATTAIGINPANQNTTCLTLRNGTTNAVNTTMLIPNVGSSSFTVYLKHASRFYNDSIFGHGYGLATSATSVDAGNSFTVTFYSLYPTINLPYTISGVLSSDLSGASLTGTFTSNYQVITFNTSTSVASTKTFNMVAGAVTLTGPQIIYVPPPFATNIYVNSTTGTSVTSILLKPWTTVSGTEPFKFSKTAGSGSYSGTYYVSSSSICDNTITVFGPVQMFDISYGTSPEYGWLSKRNLYNGGGGAYSGSNSTTYNSTFSVTGEWAQIQIPYALKLKSFTFLPTSNWVYSLPYTFYILGSNNGTTWTNLYSVSNYVYSTYITSSSSLQFTDSSYLTTFTVTPVNHAYSYFRLVVNGAFNAYPGFVGLKQWNLYGDAYTTAF